MKLYTFQVATKLGVFERIGAYLDGNIVDLNLAAAAFLTDTSNSCPYRSADFFIPPNMIKFFEGGEQSKTIARESLAYISEYIKKNGSIVGPKNERIIYNFDEIKIMAPVPRPNIVWDCITFYKHINHFYEEAGEKVPETFFKFPNYVTQSGSTCAGHGDPILWPRYTELLDFELEMGIYIGKKGINIKEEDAEDYIAGFTVYNDISARDIQKEEAVLPLGPQKGKNFENSNIMGPCLVTPDELDYNNLRMIVRANGEVVTDDNTKDMYHKYPRIISRISEDEYLYPGDFIGSGTSNYGTSPSSKLGRWLKPGDVIEMEIEGIGTIRNEVVRHK